ncbi:MAG TPA: hypothetical protein V6D30_04975 [Leptolyngbyaceae cyanobacterium]
MKPGDSEALTSACSSTSSLSARQLSVSDFGVSAQSNAERSTSKPCRSSVERCEAQIALKAEDVESQITAVVAPPVAIKSQEPIKPTHSSQVKCYLLQTNKPSVLADKQATTGLTSDTLPTEYLDQNDAIQNDALQS